MVTLKIANNEAFGVTINEKSISFGDRGWFDDQYNVIRLNQRLEADGN